jgi:hypothetical protein
MNKYKICICSGGNISHALAGVLSFKGHTINILTRQPSKWNNNITTFINTSNCNSIYDSYLNKISEDPSVALKDVDIIIIACPIMAFDDILNNIKSYLTPNMILMCIPGRLFVNYVQKNNIKNKIITLLRTPYICSIKVYGNSINISGFIHDKINYWSNSDISKMLLTNLFDFDNNQLTNHLSIDLVNSNLILHSCRLYILFHKNKCYDDKPDFYKKWCIDSSKLLILCDKELHVLIDKINVILDNKVIVKSILKHYESYDIISLTNKIKSIDALPERSPVIFKNNKYYANINHRYFQEEIIALKFVLELSEKYKVNLFNIRKIYESFIDLQNNY